jgi:predicted CXXCH cytochrome family protein
MISCLLVQLTPATGGRLARGENRVESEILEIGRGAACHVYLPDHRVSLLHARIFRTDDFSLRIEAGGDALLSVDGFDVRSAKLAAGTRIDIGPYHLTVEYLALEEGELQLAFEIPAPLPIRRIAPEALFAMGISKRQFGFSLAALILVIFLLPLATRWSVPLENWQARLPVTLTGVLNPAPLSPAHSLFGARCSTCHKKAFVAVDDGACKECHQGAAQHLVEAGSQQRLFSGTRCVDCHAIHTAKNSAIGSDNRSRPCVQCHSSQGAPLDVSQDFGDAHSPFRLSFREDQKTVHVVESDLPLPAENSHLKFSHHLHLAKEGVSSPEGLTIMTCKDCHRLDESGRYFSPIAMTTTCQQSGCHRMRFDKPLRGIVPHGSEKVLLERLRQLYVNWLADNPAEASQECMPSQKSAPAARHLVDCANQLALRQGTGSLFTQQGEDLRCALCHEVSNTGRSEMPWNVKPLRLNRDWHSAAHFPHGVHSTTPCGDCHDKTNSKTSGDVSLPALTNCRTCHTGRHGASGKLSTECADCHQFHRYPLNTTTPLNERTQTTRELSAHK